MIIIILVRAVHDPKGLFIIYTLGWEILILYTKISWDPFFDALNNEDSPKYVKLYTLPPSVLRHIYMMWFFC